MGRDDNDTAGKKPKMEAAQRRPAGSGRQVAGGRAAAGDRAVSGGRVTASGRTGSGSRVAANGRAMSGSRAAADDRAVSGSRVTADGRAMSGNRTAVDSRAGADGSAVSGGRAAAGSRTAASGRAAGGSKPREAGRTASGDRAGSETGPISGDKTGTGRRPSGGSKPRAGKKTAGKKRPSSGRSKSEGRGKTSGRRASSGRRATGDMWEGTGAGRRDEERARRKAARERKVRRQKITMVVSSCIILVSILFVVIFCLPSVKSAVQIFQGDKCRKQEDYAGAQSAYEKAVEADPSSVKAYRYLAYTYEQQAKAAEAEQLLYQGWEETKDAFLLEYYCTVVLNQAVDEINAKNCTLATVEKCVRALEQGVIDDKALELLTVCHDRLFKVTAGNDVCTLFYDEDVAQDTCSYTEYEQLLRRMLAVCQARASEEVKNVLRQYAVISMPHVRISVPHLESYAALLSEINGVLSDPLLTETTACLARAKEAGDYFGRAFDEFGAGNYAYARELITEESYLKIRDDFINGNSGYWEGETYIPVSREQLELHIQDGSVRFSFLSDEEYENRQGIILVSGVPQEDDGVQRSVIIYRPAAGADEASSTEYTMQYLYSNVKINGKYVPQMNYRLDTKVTTAEGVTTNAIGDWGGENEWEIDY